MKVSKITRYFLYLLVYVVLLAANPVSCSTQSENKYCKITLKQNVPIDEYIKSYDGYIPLETTDESLVGNISKLLYENGKLIVVDKGNNKILVFDATTGKFLNCVGHQGRGPKEFISLRDVVVADGKLYVLDMGKILTYKLSGEFVGETRYKKGRFTKMDRPRGNKIWLYSELADSCYFNRMDLTTGEIDVRHLPSIEDLYGMSGPAPIFIGEYEGDPLVARPYDNIVYRLSERSLTPFITFDFDLSGSATQQEIATLTQMKLMDKVSERKEYLYHIKHIEVKGDEIFVMPQVLVQGYSNSNPKSGLHLIRHNLKTGETKIFTREDCPKFEDAKYPFFFQYNAVMSGNKIFCYWSAASLIENKGFEQVKEDDNPYILSFTLNK
ncbi:MAG: 6-bladed beta-propeller [Alistipes sp.]|nr:6-bladed beta-propeller [Alistipes sp.]